MSPVGPASETHSDPTPGTSPGPLGNWAYGHPPGRAHRVSALGGQGPGLLFSEKGLPTVLWASSFQGQVALCVLACKAGSQGTWDTAESQRSSPHRPRAAGTYLVSQQSRNTCFRGVANGREVVAPLQGQNNPAAGQAHQLLRQVPKTCNENGRCEGRAGRARGTDAWRPIKAAAAHYVTLQARGAGALGS